LAIIEKIDITLLFDVFHPDAQKLFTVWLGKIYSISTLKVERPKKRNGCDMQKKDK
jgi:hypothetical protein